jgi:hypothetical protein
MISHKKFNTFAKGINKLKPLNQRKALNSPVDAGSLNIKKKLTEVEIKVQYSPNNNGYNFHNIRFCG